MPGMYLSEIPSEDQYRQRNHPPQLSGLRRDIMPHPGNRDLRPDRRPHQAIDGQQMFLPDLAHRGCKIANSGENGKSAGAKAQKNPSRKGSDCCCLDDWT